MQISLFVLGVLGALAAVPNDATGPKTAITLFSRDSQLPFGNGTEIVVEVVNRSADALRVSDSPTISIKAGNRDIAEVRHEIAGAADHCTIVIEVVSSARGHAAYPGSKERRPVSIVEVKPGGAHLIKLRIPPSAFTLGDNLLTTRIVRGNDVVASSESHRILVNEIKAAGRDAK